MPHKLSFARKALVASAVVVGTTAGAAGIAAAATSSSTSSTTSGSSSHPTAPSGTPPKGAPGNPASLTHGPGETLLTGTSQQKADSAATAAEPGATIVRAETDSSGKGTYEVHMKKADGTYVTVYLDSNYKVTSTGDGFGAGPAGQAGPGGQGGPGGGQPPANGQAPPSSSSASA